MKKLYVLSVPIALLAIGFANADQFHNTGNQQNIIQQGVKSLGVTGSYMSNNGSSQTQINLAISQFVNSNIEVRGGIQYLDFNGSSNTSFVVGGRYYFEPSQDKQTLPFAGVFYGYSTGSGTNHSQLGLELGLQYFLQPNVSLTPAAVWSNTSGGVGSTFGIQLGLTYWFK